jgi:hypothetical protein
MGGPLCGGAARAAAAVFVLVLAAGAGAKPAIDPEFSVHAFYYLW